MGTKFVGSFDHTLLDAEAVTDAAPSVIQKKTAGGPKNHAGRPNYKKRRKKR